ncbi:hypothetical protein [Streptomyces sp. 8N616]|uniref:hypothetical protein n=1 Tax=Streptomyces sp. 8N616 TaxID=3457414 RepID=UPI003FD5A46F
MTVGQRPVVEEPRLAIQRRSSSLGSRRRFLAAFLPLLAAVLTGVAVLGISGNILVPFERVTTLEGKMASKRDFFEDEEVQRILMKYHLRVHTTSSGSREVAIRDIASYDFVFPSGQPAGDLITTQRAAKGRYAKVHRPFVSPIVLATYREYAETLRDRGVAAPQGGTGQDRPLYYTLDMKVFLGLIEEGRKWQDLKIEDHGVTNGNKVLAQTPDVCGTNSGVTYLALVAFTRSDGDVPDTGKEADTLGRDIKPFLTGQGLPPDDLFRTYTSPEGKGIGPVVVAYEHQYLAYQAQFQAHAGKLDADRVLLYPSPQFVTQPQYIALTRAGDRLGELITHDPELRSRAMELGFRILDPTGKVAGDQLTRFLEEREIPVPEMAGDTRSAMPRLALLERMISIVGDCPPAVAEPGDRG